MTEPRIDPKFPDRPQHEDFWKMVEMVRHNDELADKGMSIADILILAGVDPQSVTYMATQRAFRVLTLLPEPTSDEERGEQLGIMWADAFLAGLGMGRAKAEDSPKIALDDSIDGNHRQGKENNK